MESLFEHKNIGIMGGTFDPIHQGHLVAAEWVKSCLYIDEVIFIPTGRPVHKRNWEVTNGDNRLKMVRLAVEGNPTFSVSDMEVIREGLTYTFDTIKMLKEKYGSETKIRFIVGADSLVDIHWWHKAAELFRMMSIIVVTRPGFLNSDFFLEKERLEKEMGADIQLVEIPDMGMSSTMIRSRVKNKLSIKYLVPDKVLDFIIEKGLYQDGV